MQIAQLVLEYLKVFLTAQVVAGVAFAVFIFQFKDNIEALILRIAKIKLPGGTEVSTSQAEKQEEASEDKPLPEPPTEETPLTLPPSLDPKQSEQVKQLLEAERVRSCLWEYRYLNLFLAYRTQQVLDWFCTLSAPTTLSLFDTIWLPAVPRTEERRAIITALQAHDLIQIDNELVSISPKGRQYLQWRGPLPQQQI